MCSLRRTGRERRHRRARGRYDAAVNDEPALVLQRTRGAVRRTLDGRFWIAAVLGSAAALLILGLPTALIPNPVFGRQVAPEAWAYVAWLVSAPLAGLVLATYLSPVAGSADMAGAAPERSGALASLAGLGVFLAVGCPVCNKVALVLLGTSGALTVFGPLQPVLGAASIVGLAATLWWRLRTRGRACPLPATRGG